MLPLFVVGLLMIMDIIYLFAMHSFAPTLLVRVLHACCGLHRWRVAEMGNNSVGCPKMLPISNIKLYRLCILRCPRAFFEFVFGFCVFPPHK